MQLIESRKRKNRQNVAIFLILIVVMALVLSYFTQPFGNGEDSQEKVYAQVGWIAAIFISTIMILAAIVQLTGYSPRDLLSSANIKTDENDFPFEIIRDYDQLLDYLFPDPQNPSISDRKIKHLSRLSKDVDEAFKKKGFVLFRGKSKTGKTREACELLRRWWYTGPTVLIAKSHVSLSRPFKIPENLPVRNLIIFFDDIDRYLDEKNNIQSLEKILEFFQKTCHNPGEFRVIATARQEDEFWGKLNFEKTQFFWNRFVLIQIDRLSIAQTIEFISQLSEMTGIGIEANITKTLAEKNDGTFLNLALAFRGWLNQEIKTITTENVHDFDGALKLTWRRRYEEISKLHPEVKPIYAAINFMQVQNISLYPSLIHKVAAEMSLRYRTQSFLSLLDKLSYRFDMSPLFNWYRNKDQLKLGAVILILFVYLWTYFCFRFLPIDFLIMPLGTILLFLPWVFFMLIPFLEPAANNLISEYIWQSTTRRIEKGLALLIATEIPIRINELRPYENQIEGNGETNNWDIDKYLFWEKNSQNSELAIRIRRLFSLIAKELIEQGMFKTALDLASKALQNAPNDPKLMFLIARIEFARRNYKNAFVMLRACQGLYHGSNLVSSIYNWRALIHITRREYDLAEINAKKALQRNSDLSTSRWVLGLVQLKAGNILAGRKNCEIAYSKDQSPQFDIMRELKLLGVTQEDWFRKLAGQRKQIPKSYLQVFVLLLLLISTGFLASQYTNKSKTASNLFLANALLTTFPDSPIFLSLRAYQNEEIGDAQKAITDFTHVIEIDPQYAGS